MIYTEYNKLTIYQVVRDNDIVDFSELAKLLMDRPSNMIYCEKNGSLYGIISTGDIRRAHEAEKSELIINKSFTCVTEKEYMRVKKVFHENIKINALPVIDKMGKLLGEYARWDDKLFSFKPLDFLMDKYVVKFLRGGQNKLALVVPCDKFEWKKRQFDKWSVALVDTGFQVEIINRDSVIAAFENNNYVIFMDEDERRGTGTLFKYILGKNFNWKQSLTCKSIGGIMRDTMGESILKSLQEKGVHVLTMKYVDNNSEYWRCLQRDLKARYPKVVYPQWSEDFSKEYGKTFLGELYSDEYSKSILTHEFELTHVAGITKLKDEEGRFFNVTDGERLTVGQPAEYNKSIYFYGACISIGLRVEDAHTIESWMQKRLNENQKNVRVVNYGCCSDWFSILNRIVSTKYRQGDIVVIYMRGEKYEGIPNLNVTDVCEKNNVPIEWMERTPLHGNHKLNHLYADAIYEELEDKIDEDVSLNQKIDLDCDIVVEQYIEQHFTNFCKDAYDRIGSIVMNCNPFTNGHRYLIEQALKQVDYLIIFVVEENRSIFTYEERFLMVSEGVKDLGNVMVVPSGPLILSQTTFPEYFLKIADEDIVDNVEYDITLFAERIAPKLNITYRFVGEELEDQVTNEYNGAMKRILPRNGVNIVEIPRKQIDSKAISASSVRGCLDNGDMNRLRDLIPESTMNILFLKNE